MRKIFKKSIDKSTDKWYNNQAVREDGRKYRETRKKPKKVEKTFKKGIDKRERVWYNNQAVAQSGSK